jgi:hypothetical protein
LKTLNKKDEKIQNKTNLSNKKEISIKNCTKSQKLLEH